MDGVYRDNFGQTTDNPETVALVRQPEPGPFGVSGPQTSFLPHVGRYPLRCLGTASSPTQAPH